MLIQYFNPSYTQQWQTGLRVWSLTSEQALPWLPSSIASGFTDASPLRFLIHFLTAAFFGFAIFNFKTGNKDTPLILIATLASLIALIGIVQGNLGSTTILGLFDARGEGLGLFFGTFLYKNHAAAYFNLAMAVSLAVFLNQVDLSKGRRSNPSLFFLICALVLLAGIIVSRSRFGFVCSLPILILFCLIGFSRIRKWSVSKVWLSVAGAGLVVLVIGGAVFLIRSPAAKHLQTLNTEITEDFSYKQRKLAYESGFKMFAEKPIYGWGAGNFRHGFRAFQNRQTERMEAQNPFMERHELNFFWQHIHNDYLEWLIELGVVGTLILLSIPGYLFWRIFKSGRWREPIPLMLLAGLASTTIHALVDFPFQNPAVLVTWFALLALTTSYCDCARREKNNH